MCTPKKGNGKQFGKQFRKNTIVVPRRIITEFTRVPHASAIALAVAASRRTAVDDDDDFEF